MPDRHTVSTHIDTPDGIGSWTTRQLALMVAASMFVGPAAALVVPAFGPALADAIEPGLLPLSQILAWLGPVSVAAVSALPLNPPAEHGAIAWARYRAAPRLLGPREVDELLGQPSVDRNIAHAHGKSIAIWEMPSVSMRMASDAARSVDRARWAAFLDGLPCSIQTTVRAVPLDLAATLETMVKHPNPNGRKTANYLRSSTVAGGEIERRRLLSISADDDDQLDRFAEDIVSGLARASLLGRRLEDDDLADTLHQGWTSKPRKGKRIGPSTIRIEANGLFADGEWMSTLAQQRWPTSVATDFMAPLYDGSLPVDVVQIIKPQDSEKTRRDLEGHLQRMTTTTATRTRTVAVEQLNALLESIERNEERIYDVEMYYLVRAPTEKLRDARRRKVQQIASESGGQIAGLRWEHAEGTLACGATVEARPVLRRHRVDTSTISRAYPWSASELGLQGAVPWGRTLYGNRRVGWTPFRRPQIANPNVAVYGASGSGKGFAIKVWTARALFAGVLSECFMVDQAEESADGEYGRWARYVGGEVRKLYRDTWEADLQRALRDIPFGVLPPALVLNIAELSKQARCVAMAAFKRTVFARAADCEANRAFGLDEMWSFQDDKEASGEAEDLVRRGRHVKLASFFMTQRPMDALDSPLGKTVQSQCASQWFGMQFPSEISDVSARLRWTPEQIQVIERFGPGDGMLVAGLQRVAFRVDYSPEEWDMAQTDYSGVKGITDHGRTQRVALADERTGWPVAAGSSGNGADFALDLASSRRLDTSPDASGQ